MQFDLFLRPPLRPVLHSANVGQFSGNRQLFLSYEMSMTKTLLAPLYGLLPFVNCNK